jgi:hypothetical protein
MVPTDAEKEFKWTAEAVYEFLRVLELPPSPDIEKQLRMGGMVQIRCPNCKSGAQKKAEVNLYSPGWTKPEEHFRFSPPEYWPFREFTFYARTGRVTLRTTPTLTLTEGRAFLRSGNLDDLAELQEGIWVMRPFLATMGLEDLEGAIGVLGGLREGESQYKEPYVMARGVDFWALRRGLILGDPLLDGKVLLGGDIEATYPGKVGISFKATHAGEWLYLYNLSLSFGEEVVVFDRGEETPASFIEKNLSASFIEKNPIATAIQRVLEPEFERLDWAGPASPLYGASPKMLAFLRAFAKHEDPFEALAEGRFHFYTTAELFADF